MVMLRQLHHAASYGAGCVQVTFSSLEKARFWGCSKEMLPSSKNRLHSME